MIRITTAAAVGLLVATTLAQTLTEGPGQASFSTIVGAGGTILSTVSACDDCTEAVALPRAFNWFGTAINNVTVASNGQINIDGSTNNNCCSADPIPGPYTGPRIAVAQEDLDPGDYGDLYFVDTGSSVIIEWAGVAFFSQTGEVNAQVEMFDDGDIEIRYGTGNTGGNSIAGGVEDPGMGEFSPITTIGGFSGTGIYTGSWPTDTNVRFSQPGGGGGEVPGASPWSLAIAGLLLLLIATGRIMRP